MQRAEQESAKVVSSMTRHIHVDTIEPSGVAGGTPCPCPLVFINVQRAEHRVLLSIINRGEE
jgi:hypothetical protein